MHHAPIAAALAESVASLTRKEQRLALQGCAWLICLLPGLAEANVEPLSNWEPIPGQERRLMSAALARSGGASCRLVVSRWPRLARRV